MNRLKFVFRVLVAVAAIAGAVVCKGQPAGHHVVAELRSESIGQNMIGENPVRKVHIYLPPLYEASDKRYPVVYFLHGYGDSPDEFFSTHSAVLDSMFLSGSDEFILAVFDGNNKTGGSFYVNSPVSGNWENFVVDDVVGYVDRNYRTLPTCESRGIAGFSMGGFGALNIALRHPDVFCSVFVFAPGVFAEGHLPDVFASWEGCDDVKHSYAQAFSPNRNAAYYGNVPQFSGSLADSAIVVDWNSGFGNWNYKIGKYLSLNRPLKGVQLSCSSADYYKWIPQGCQQISKTLNAQGVPNSIVWFDGGHIIPRDGMARWFSPFFRSMLSF